MTSPGPLILRSASLRGLRPSAVVVALLLLVGCATSYQRLSQKSYPPYDGEIAVLNELPAEGDYIKVGVVAVASSVPTKGLAQIKRQARRVGADTIVWQGEIRQGVLQVQYGSSALLLRRRNRRAGSCITREAAAAPDGASVTPPESRSPPRVSRRAFDSLRLGMSYEEVTALLGGPGTLESEAGGGLGTTVRHYEWSDPASGANIVCVFTGGALSVRTQFGLD